MHLPAIKRRLHGTGRFSRALIMSAIVVGGYTAPAFGQRKTKPKTSQKSAAAKVVSDSQARPAEPSLWPVASPTPLAGAILPAKRIVAFYGNPHSKRMGILGELEPATMLAKLDREVGAWEKADSTTPVQPALHLIAVVASDEPGPSGKYRTRMDSALIEQ